MFRWPGWHLPGDLLAGGAFNHLGQEDQALHCRELGVDQLVVWRVQWKSLRSFMSQEDEELQCYWDRLKPIKGYWLKKYASSFISTAELLWLVVVLIIIETSPRIFLLEASFTS